MKATKMGIDATSTGPCNPVFEGVELRRVLWVEGGVRSEGEFGLLADQCKDVSCLRRMKPVFLKRSI